MAEPAVHEEAFLSGGPKVCLTRAFEAPFQNVVDTARTCYSAKGIVEGSEGYDHIAKSIYKAGHHTTYQHPTFQFTIENVSRHCIWSFLHGHTFYNSEQVSQRYVKVKAGNVAIPHLPGPAQALYEETVSWQQEVYEQLSKLLFPAAQAEYFRLFPTKAKDPDKWKKDVRRKCYEAARYVLPVATTAYLYHTVSGLTLLRYYRLCQAGDTPTENRLLAEAMVGELLKHDPSYQAILEQPLPGEELPENQILPQLVGTGAEWCQEFDEKLAGRLALLVNDTSENEAVVADAVRALFAIPATQLSDEDAIRLALDPSQNRILGQTLNLTSHHQLSRALTHAHYTFFKRISHTADSQNQRPRMTPASRPILARHLHDAPDYATPRLMAAVPEAQKIYDDAMARTWDAMTKLRQMGTREEFVQYLLPNAVNLRMVESADLLNLRHKHVMRLCYNAQEEIWQASVDEAIQVREKNPIIGKYLLPPCGVRAQSKTKPICPEGDRYCGVRVWKLDLTDYTRLI